MLKYLFSATVSALAFSGTNSAPVSRSQTTQANPENKDSGCQQLPAFKDSSANTHCGVWLGLGLSLFFLGTAIATQFRFASEEEYKSPDYPCINLWFLGGVAMVIVGGVITLINLVTCTALEFQNQQTDCEKDNESNSSTSTTTSAPTLSANLTTTTNSTTTTTMSTVHATILTTTESNTTDASESTTTAPYSSEPSTTEAPLNETTTNHTTDAEA